MQRPDFERTDIPRKPRRNPFQPWLRWRGLPVRYLLVRLALNCISIWVAASLVDGVTLREPWSWWQLVLVGIVFGLLNAVVKPVVMLFSLPALIVTLGLFYLVVNALILWMTPLLAPVLVVSGFWAALKGGIVISLVNWTMSWLLGIK